MNAKKLQKKIFPLPKQVEVKDGALKLDKVALKVAADVHTAKQAAAVLEKKLAALGIGVCDCAKTTITLNLGEAPAQVQFAEQGYRIAVTAEGVELTGFGAQGVYYAAVSFVQILDKEIPCCDIWTGPTWPSVATSSRAVWAVT